MYRCANEFMLTLTEYLFNIQPQLLISYICYVDEREKIIKLSASLVFAQMPNHFRIV